MLERFHVPREHEVRVSDAALRRTITDLFIACGVPEADAATGAGVLTKTDLRGVETHGVSNMLRSYIGWFQNGQLNPDPKQHIIRETPGTATIDGDRGLGLIQGTAAMQLAIDKAREVGVGVVTMRNSGHLGAVGHFSMQAAEQDMVGICLTAMSVLVLPTFGAIPRLGTNPISIAAPARTEPFLLYDAATSTIAGNKIALARRVGANMEPGWIAEPDGSPIMEERPVPEGSMYALGAYNLLPLGGTREQGSHKGYGLGLMVEVLTTLLSGAVPSMVEEKPPLASHHFAAYNIAAFDDVVHFKDTMDRTLQTLTETPPAPGHERVIYPGLSEAESEIDRKANGIPLHREVIDWFNRTTDELGVARIETL
ncbi:MAG TPA: Ldh family oxidoreductase [Thermomicrobiales bacterium]|nr:Ldh family oxidoreductase [Thermomicrobiales bacterium]